MNRWRETRGIRPNTSSEKVFVRYRCGIESKAAYPVASQRWNFAGHDFDIVAYKVPEEDALRWEEEARRA